MIDTAFRTKVLHAGQSESVRSLETGNTFTVVADGHVEPYIQDTFQSPQAIMSIDDQRLINLRRALDGPAADVWNSIRVYSPGNESEALSFGQPLDSIVKANLGEQWSSTKYFHGGYGTWDVGATLVEGDSSIQVRVGKTTEGDDSARYRLKVFTTVASVPIQQEIERTVNERQWFSSGGPVPMDQTTESATFFPVNFNKPKFEPA